MRTSRRALLGAGLAGAALPWDMARAEAPAGRGGTLRIGMTAAAVPLPNGQTDQGGEGQRFMAYTVFDSLVFWDLSRSDAPSRLVPNLATEWTIDPADSRRWLFTLREGVRFHDGSAFDAHAAQWNFEKLLDSAAPHFDPRQAAQGRSRIPSVAKATALDARTLEIRTTEVDALLPYGLAWIVMSSPAQWEKVGRSWDAFLAAPSGTGPFRMVEYSQRERGVMVANPDYWNPARKPRLERLVLLPLPEANTRAAALRSGQVDWIEAPAPDVTASLRGAGFRIVTNEYPHNWVWHLDLTAPGSIWRDVRVRRAANLAVDRDGIAGMMDGQMLPGVGLLTPSSPWFGNPSFRIRHDPAEARKLLAEAGFGPRNPARTKVMIPGSGSGMMQPLPMNEAIQENLREVGIAVEFEVMEWNALLNAWRAGSRDPLSRGVHALNYSYFSQDPFTALIRHVDSALVAPRGTNWGHTRDAELDAVCKGLRETFDPAAQDALMARGHQRIVDEAMFLFVAHDLNARAMSPKVRGFVQARNWFQDLGTVSMA
ncbi:ABC transporter substrate-binding protein [Roseomonas nepalensis]|uniref:ABC transporter substrate-binding protein n=1 Tax=Muricoccus nepalensis TaxID=1854500 RepID=A0A502FIC9_9PROT|nr:ABC transporter substrate-binding protein [Roseomonas nepalensis]TPG49208.1 ABC transporter substrate-binding protein [Roseomonas nepalensis]